MIKFITTIALFVLSVYSPASIAACKDYASCDAVVKDLGGNWGLTDRDGDRIPCENVCSSREEVLSLLDKYGRKPHTGKLYEIDYAKVLCHKLNGQIEYRLPDKTRVDCLTDDSAIEVDFPNKIDECITQAKHYGSMTGKKSVCAIIITDDYDKSIIDNYSVDGVDIVGVIASRGCTLAYMVEHDL